ncbi:MAG: hypothetical protein ABIJ97_08700 [Bacteroidota bacterium]
MNDLDFTLYEDEIPKVFKSFISEELFTHCINCGKYLLDQDVHYLIEKAIYQGNVEFEHAICIDCATEMRGYMSEESTKAINDFFEKNFNQIERMQKLFSENESPSLEKWMEKCAISHQPIENLSEYQIFAHCNGTKLIYSVMPFIISGEITEKLSELLSKKTREELDDYMEKHFDLPPEMKEIFIRKKILIH